MYYIHNLMYFCNCKSQIVQIVWDTESVMNAQTLAIVKIINVHVMKAFLEKVVKTDVSFSSK